MKTSKLVTQQKSTFFSVINSRDPLHFYLELQIATAYEVPVSMDKHSLVHKIHHVFQVTNILSQLQGKKIRTSIIVSLHLMGVSTNPVKTPQNMA